MLSFIVSLIKSVFFMSGSYSNKVFLDPLSKEDEEKYIDLMLKKDNNARNKLIEHNLILVAHIVNKYESINIDTDDLISIGTIGLIKGIDSYKKDLNTKITTYAARCIENEILMHFRSIKKHQNTVSLDDTIGYDKDGNAVSLIDVIKDNKEPLEEQE